MELLYRFVSLGEVVDGNRTVEQLAYSGATRALVEASTSNDPVVVARTAVRGALRALMENSIVLATASVI